MTLPSKIYGLLTPVERRTASALLALTMIGVVLEALGIGLVIPAIALLTQSDPAAHYPLIRRASIALGRPTQAELVVIGMLTLVAIYVIKSGFLVYLAWRQMTFVFGVQARISKQLFATYLRQPYAFHLQRNSAQLIRNATTETAMFAGVLIDVLHLLSEGCVLVGIAALLVFVEPIGTMLVGVVLGSAALGFHRATHTRVTRWGLIRQRHEGLRIQHLQQGLGGVKDIKLYGCDDSFITSYHVHNAECARVTQRQQTLLLIPRLWMELLAVSGLAILVVSMLLRGRDMSTVVPALALFAAAAFRLMPLFNRALNGMQSLRFGLPVVNILRDELALGAARADRVESRRFQSELRLAAVGYAYPLAQASAISDVTLCVRRNECVGFVGPSGSGKSTLVDVILGLLTPTAGAVIVDGWDVQQDIRAWQEQIGYVPQTIFLTDDSLRRNIAFGVADEDIDEGAVKRAISAAQLEDFVASLPDGLETTVGERGVRLSGGQRQRIGIARALYRDPQVLVLDEATSALDTETERGVMQAVAALQGTKTILIVAHRASSVAHCDRLYRLEQGRVAAEGAPAAILRA